MVDWDLEIQWGLTIKWGWDVQVHKVFVLGWWFENVKSKVHIGTANFGLNWYICVYPNNDNSDFKAVSFS